MEGEVSKQYSNDPERITYFGQTDTRNMVKKFGIKSKDRTKHMYVIGKTGMGKSTLIENMVVQDIMNGNGIALIDPHGASAEKILEYIPRDRIDDVVYFAPFDLDYPIAFNVMEDVGYDKRHLVVNGLMSAFRKIWVDAWSSRMEYILTNTILALLEYPDATMLGVNRMYTDKGFRKAVVDNIKDPLVKAFWVEEFATYTDRYTQEATPAIQNKIGQFTGNPLIRNIIGQPESSFDLRDIIDNRKIFICNLSKGLVGEVNANLLGSMLITKIYLAAMGRADVSPAELDGLPNFYLYVDEFQSFANESFADILSEARKYKLNLTMAHQYIEQMSEEVRAAVFGNVGTMITFRVGAYDADVLEKEYTPQFTAQDLVNLGFTQVYLKLMIDGVGSQPFSATTLPPIECPEVGFADHVIAASRKNYGAPREEVEKHVSEWHLVKDEDGNPIPNQHQQPDGASKSQKQNARPNDRPNDRPRRDTGGDRRQERPRRERNEHRDNRDRGERREPRKEMPEIEVSNHKAQLADIAKAMHTERKEKVEKREVKQEEKRAKDKEDLKSALAGIVAQQKAEKPKEEESQAVKVPQPSPKALTDTVPKANRNTAPQKEKKESRKEEKKPDTIKPRNAEVSEDELKQALG